MGQSQCTAAFARIFERLRGAEESWGAQSGKQANTTYMDAFLQERDDGQQLLQLAASRFEASWSQARVLIPKKLSDRWPRLQLEAQQCNPPRFEPSDSELAVSGSMKPNWGCSGDLAATVFRHWWTLHLDNIRVILCMETAMADSIGSVPSTAQKNTGDMIAFVLLSSINSSSSKSRRPYLPIILWRLYIDFHDALCQSTGRFCMQCLQNWDWVIC